MQKSFCPRLFPSIWALRLLQKLDFAQIVLHNDFFEVKILKAFEYQKAEESKRKYYVKEPSGLDTQLLTFHQ